MAADTFIPVIDISPYLAGTPEGKRQVAAEVARAGTEVGFFLITGHGVDPGLIEQVETVSRDFFDRPLDEKMALRITGEPGAVGYSAVGDIALAYTRGKVAPFDLNESFQIAKVGVAGDAYFNQPAARGLVPANRWPAHPENFRDVWERYYLRMGALATDLMRICALALDLPENYFNDKIDRHISRLTARLYPAQTEAPLPGQLRAAEHTDYGTVTILKPTETPGGGLQVADADGHWHDVPVIQDAFIINLGDCMALWTNDRWRSALHRVANPPEAARGIRRSSIVFFHHANHDAVIECLPTCGTAKYPAMPMSEYYVMKRTQQRMAREKAKAA
jgi:isopenicillin N synthase-like dioxygenase